MNPNQSTHQNQILDGLRRPSHTIRSWWLALKDLPTPSKPAWNLFWWCWKVFRHHPSPMYGPRSSSETIQNLILLHRPIRVRGCFRIHENQKKESEEDNWWKRKKAKLTAFLFQVDKQLISACLQKLYILAVELFISIQNWWKINNNKLSYVLCPLCLSIMHVNNVQSWNNNQLNLEFIYTKWPYITLCYRYNWNYH